MSNKPLFFKLGENRTNNNSEKNAERIAIFRGTAEREAFIKKHGHAPEHMTIDELGGDGEKWKAHYPLHMAKHLVNADEHIHEIDGGYYVLAPGARTNGRCVSGHCK